MTATLTPAPLTATISRLLKAQTGVTEQISHARRALAEIAGDTSAIAVGMKALREAAAATEAYLDQQLTEVNTIVGKVQTKADEVAQAINEALAGEPADVPVEREGEMIGFTTLDVPSKGIDAGDRPEGGDAELLDVQAAVLPYAGYDFEDSHRRFDDLEAPPCDEDGFPNWRLWAQQDAESLGYDTSLPGWPKKVADDSQDAAREPVNPDATDDVPDLLPSGPVGLAEGDAKASSGKGKPTIEVVLTAANAPVTPADPPKSKRAKILLARRLLREGTLTQREIANQTGLSQTKICRLAKEVRGKKTATA